MEIYTKTNGGIIIITNEKRIAYIVIVVCLLIAFGTTVTINWLYETFGHLSMDEIIFHLKVPMEGTNMDIIFTFLKECLWKVILPTIIISFALIYPMVKDIKFIKEIHTSEKRRTTLTSTCIAVLVLIPDGFLCKDCPNKWDEQYKNVISCSSKRVGDFVKWLQEQDFYDNTTIVITGDHLTMQANFFEPEEGQQYDKKVVNVIINPAIEAENTKRAYSTMDLYPATLGTLGAKIEGNRLALGTNLFSDEKTLIEKYGVEYVNNELKKVSRFYNNSILVK